MATIITYQDPVGYWPIDEGSGGTLRDVSPWRNDGTLVSANGGPPTWADGGAGKALDFADQGYVSIPNSDVITPQPMTIFVRVYIRTGAVAAGHDIRIMEQTHAPGERSWMIYQLVDNDKVIFLPLDSAGSSVVTSSDSAGPTGEWITIVATVDPVGNTALWINGVKQADTDTLATGVLRKGNGPLLLSNDDATRHLDGMIDVPVIWNRVLSRAEIQMYSQDPGLIGNYQRRRLIHGLS